MTLHRPHLSLALVLSLAFPVVACSAVQSVQSVAANALLPVSEENKLGAQMKKEVEKELKVHKSEEVQSYLERLGNKIAKKARDKPEGIKFTFTVIDDDKTINAFAIPGGHIYVYSGLMKAASDEAELAGVVGHEIAHVTQRHIAERLVAQYGLQTVLGLALGKDPGLLGQIAAQVGGTGALLKFTRDQESEADARGLPYMVAAGYDPDAMVSFFKKLQKGEGSGALVFLSDHPLPSDRVEALQTRIKRMRNKPDTRNKEQLDDVKSKL
jgi:beta-barrel assembly-enhancing protease